MATTQRVLTKGVMSAIGTLIIGQVNENFPCEPLPPTLGAILSYTTTGSPTAVTLQFEGSQNGTSGWTSIGASLTSLTTASASMISTVYPFVRANLSVLTAGTSPTLIITITTQGGN